MKTLALGAAALGLLVQTLPASDGWLSWTSRQAEAIGKAAYVQGRVGGLFDTRLLKTERSYNYKLAATWMHPDVIRASARLVQLTERLSVEETKAIVAQAETAGQIVVMVEIDPREGSGVIPSDWLAFLQPVMQEGSPATPTRGRNEPRLRDVRALAGVQRRNYDYDRFWIVFPNKHPDGTSTIPENAVALELIVRILDREGRVRWRLLSVLKAQGAEVAYYDPHVPVIGATREHGHWQGLKSVDWNGETISGFDAVLISTAHKAVDYQELADWATCIVDTRNAMAGYKVKAGVVWKA